MGEAWRLTPWRILLPGLDDKVHFFLVCEFITGGPFLKRVPVAPPCEGFHLSYVMTLVVQLIDVAVCGFVSPPLSTQVDPVQPPTSRGEPTRTGQGGSSSKVASSDPVCF